MRGHALKRLAQTDAMSRHRQSAFSIIGPSDAVIRHVNLCVLFALLHEKIFLHLAFIGGKDGTEEDERLRVGKVGEQAQLVGAASGYVLDVASAQRQGSPGPVHPERKRPKRVRR